MEILFTFCATIVFSGLIYLLYKNSLYVKQKEAEKLQDQLVVKMQGSDKPDYEKLAKTLKIMYKSI